MKSTERLGLALPEPSDYVNIETLNENFRRLDALTPSDINAAPQDHGAHVPAVQDADNAKFLRNDNTWQKVTPANIGAVPTTRTVNGKALSSDITLSAADVGAAATSHGNHVPAPQTANSATFLRNDNTWQKVTPADIGAVNRAGDKMTGDLEIQTANPAVKVRNTATGILGKIQSTAGGNVALARIEDEKNQRLIEMNSNGSLRYAEMIDGVWTNTQILHTGNLEALNMARIVTGSYVGTGTYGSNNENILNLSIKPRLLIVAGENCMMIASYGVAFGLFFCEITGTSSNVQVNSVLWGDSTVQWWSTNGTYGPEFQMNTNGKQYHYVAVG